MPHPHTRPIVQESPHPWEPGRVWVVGGLQQAGFAEGTDLLLVASTDGRGVFDCLSDRRVARDTSERYAWDMVRLTVPGIGPLAGQAVRTGGLFGGGLTHTTADGWFLEERAPAWPVRGVYLLPPHDGPARSRPEAVCVGESGTCDLRTYGFSETGLSFVIATSCDLTVFRRRGAESA